MKLLVANWKMNPASVAEAIALAKATDFESVVLCPPFPFLADVKRVVQKAQLGAQDVFWHDPAGPFTGEVSAAELISLGVTYVILGHSERRRCGETDEVIGKKVAAVLQANLIPIVCVGETSEEKLAGKKEVILSRQVEAVFSSLEPRAYKLKPMYIAYEPVWSISTEPGAVADTPENAVSTIDHLRDCVVKLDLENVNIKFLYGGSVSAATAPGFLKESAIDGVLVGGASLKPDELQKIWQLLK